MELLYYNINIIVLILIAINCVWSFSVEPKYTKFEYEEQLLEKVVRFEVYAENLNNAVQKFISDFSIIVNETKKSTEKEISIGNDRMNLMKSEIEDFNQNVTSTMAQEQQSIRDLHEKLNEKFETKTNELARFEEDLNKKFKAKTEELKQYEERMNKMFETKTEELTRLEEQFNQKFESKTEELTRLAVTPLIAFNAYGKTDGSYTASTPVVFEQVLLNEGDCYDNTTGFFTASVDGIYQFNAQICFLKNVDLEYKINVDSVSVIRGESRAASDSGDDKCDSFSVTTRVNKGQNVFVAAYNTKLDANPDDWNSFSGSIIRQL